MRLVCKTTSIIQNSTRKNIKIQERTAQDKILWHWIIFCFIRFLRDKMLFWYFRQPVRKTKSCDVVWWGTKISVFVMSLASSLSCTWNSFTNQILDKNISLSCPLFFSKSNALLKRKWYNPFKVHKICISNYIEIWVVILGVSKVKSSKCNIWMKRTLKRMSS